MLPHMQSTHQKNEVGSIPLFIWCHTHWWHIKKWMLIALEDEKVES